MNLSRDDSKQKVFMDLYGPCHDSFSRYCRGITSNPDDARDLAAEAILVVFENLSRLRKRDSFKSYLFGVARRLRLNQHRKKRFQGEYKEGEALLLLSNEAPPDIHPDVELLYNYLDRLPPNQKDTFLLFEVSGFSLKEIQQLQGGTISGVKSRLKRAREQLRLWLNDEDERRLKAERTKDEE
ncbi:MAG: RNA polymerase sigma factor [Bacteroidetes bacterium]|jgi:RNA polymerase sigma-70 factor, ECF subfamily|nr:RNA polymerase sigma factor [Bacteroidota bacterium]MBT3748072.1 RNA polymerase sigma factor [Bacteroidota bacterium]MBT4400734.1 RNA polymerase sigma factor [Bacteroidota bacterium]MBT4408460.1 RNA polymerase sigma factor [Bacteroidota bacterium]MBT5428102.1 RNA polymerase sigma factor [Bacteroidota bacterium]